MRSDVVPSSSALTVLGSSVEVETNGDTVLVEGGTEVESSSPLSGEYVTYETFDLPHSLIHVIRIAPDAPVTIQPVVDPDGLEKLEVLAEQQGAIAAINGGFFDPNNQQTTSYVTIAGTLVLDPEQNRGLMENPNVSTYLPRILNRAEFRRYQCATANGLETDYAIAAHNRLIPSGCQLMDALGAGPALLPEFRGEAEAFIDATSNRDALGASRPNARSGLGITPDGTILLIMAAQRPPVGDVAVSPTGVSLFELAQIMADLGAEQGMNLDGGSSSSLYYDGTTYYGRLDVSGNEIRRSVKSVLVVTKNNGMQAPSF
ncbi:MAG: phosphodiester glycosidase family protein [Cyanothece sp. SIO2G6]|nr:phosphodiester glycosidase family protein [Cyanothece sp. SIO2G6]